MSTDSVSGRADISGVQSVNRALDLLEAVASARRPMSVGDIAVAAGLPVPTAHRLVRTLVDRGFMRQLADRTYALGFRLVALGEAANDLAGLDVESVLADLVKELGESANLAVLAGDQAEYVAQAESTYAMRMFTQVGRKVDLHSTGVGKAILSTFDPDVAVALVRRRGMRSYTPYTVTTETRLVDELEQIRSRGYAIDDQEQEIGVRCVAVPIDAGPGSWMAVSVSGPSTRMTDDVVARAAPLLARAARRIVDRLHPA